MFKTQKVKNLEQQANEYKNVIRIVELFLLEKGLTEEFSNFVKSVVQEFEKSQSKQNE